MMFARKLSTDRGGSAAIEFAIAVPILVSFVWGIFQVGILYRANAGMQHALGEAARYATIFPTPGNDDIKDKVDDRKFGTDNGSLAELQIEDFSSTCSGELYKDLTLNYSHPTDFLFFQGPTVSLTRTKRVYVVPGDAQVADYVEDGEACEEEE